MDIEVYLPYLYRHIPNCIYLGCLALLLLCVLVVIVHGGISKRWRILSKVLFFEYLFLIYCSTVIYRTRQENCSLKLVPLKGLFEEGYLSDSESQLNVLMFVPLGFLLGLACNGVRWWKTLIIFISISLSIEVLQYITQRGFYETDDVIRNTAGCMIGYGIYRFISYLKKKFVCLFNCK